MKKIGFLKSSLMVLRANRMTFDEITKLQTQRRDSLISYAREHSPYFKEAYKDLGENPSFDSLPVITKREMMKVFDQWVTDPSITLEKIKAFMSDEDNIGRKMDNKCIPHYTSGSTGIQCIVLTDKSTDNVMLTLNYLRSFLRSSSFIKSILKGAKYTAIFAPGFYIEYSQIRDQMLHTPFSKYRTQFINVVNPIGDIVRQLNEFQPNILATYPSSAALLLPEIKAGRLKIKPDIFVLGGENSSAELRKSLRELLKGSVYDTYGATEAAMLAFECKEGHLHLNSDWVILEPVDENNKPVPPGVCSHKVLLTNLSNYLQPFIRYEMTDRVTMYDEPCPCGSRLPHISVEGRTDDILEFESIRGPVKVIPFNLMPESDMAGLLRYQLVQKDPETLEMRLHCVDQAAREEAYSVTKQMILKHLEINQVNNVNVYLSDTLPQFTTQSGKFKSVYKENATVPITINGEQYTPG